MTTVSACIASEGVVGGAEDCSLWWLSCWATAQSHLRFKCCKCSLETVVGSPGSQPPALPLIGQPSRRKPYSKLAVTLSPHNHAAWMSSQTCACTGVCHSILSSNMPLCADSRRFSPRQPQPQGLHANHLSRPVICWNLGLFMQS